MKAIFQSVWPYQNDQMNLPVGDLEASLPFYEKIMGFKMISRSDLPHKSAILQRDGLQIGLAENGGDPTQDGCFFGVDNAEIAFNELKNNGLEQDAPKYDFQQYGENRYKVFFVIAPDGLCYCLGEKIN